MSSDTAAMITFCRFIIMLLDICFGCLIKANDNYFFVLLSFSVFWGCFSLDAHRKGVCYTMNGTNNLGNSFCYYIVAISKEKTLI